jgi:hypothetical protein
MTANDIPLMMRLLSAPPVLAILDSPLLGVVKRALMPNRPSQDPLAQVISTQFSLLPGFTRAVASSMRHGPIRGLESKYSRLGELSRTGHTRVLLIWVRLLFVRPKAPSDIFSGYGR